MRERMLTVKELARYLSLSERTVYNMIRQGQIPFAKVGGQYRFGRQEIDQWLSQRGKPRATVLDRVRETPDVLTKRLLFMGALTAALEPTGITPVVVGGNAVEFYTAGGYATGDIDIIAPSEPVDAVLRNWGFSKEGRHWYSDDYGIVIEAPGLFLEREQYEKALQVEIDDLKVYLIAVEDLIVDRLSAYVHWKSEDDRFWARELLALHTAELDRDYLARRARIQGVLEALDELLKESAK